MTGAIEPAWRRVAVLIQIASLSMGNGTNMRDTSYKSYVRGLDMLGMLEHVGCAYPIRSRADYELARSVLESLKSSAIGAGQNTYAQAKSRYDNAKARFIQIPEPKEYCKLGHRNCSICGV